MSIESGSKQLSGSEENIITGFEIMCFNEQRSKYKDLLSTSKRILIDHFMHIHAKFLSFQKDKEFFDIDLIVGVDKVYVPAHRIVLSASSKFFHELFSKNPEQENNSNSIELKQFDAVTIQNIVNFMYTAEIEISANTVDALREATEFLGVESLKNACTSGNIKSDTKTVLFKGFDHIINFTKTINDLYMDKRFFDITLFVGVEKFEAHIAVIAASSDYFRAMFQNKLNAPQSSEVQVKDVDSATMKLILDFIYNGSTQLCSETVENVMRAANFFNIKSLVDTCTDFMERRLDTSNCLGVALFAEQHGHLELYKKSFEMVCFWFTKVCKEEEFLQLSEEQLIKLISNKELYAHLEDELFLGLAAWVKNNISDREKCIPKLLSFVCFDLLKPEFIEKNKHLLCANSECEEIIDNCLQRLPLSSIADKVTRRVFKKIIFVGNGFGRGHVPNCFKVTSFDPDLGKFSLLDWPTPKVPRKMYANIIIDNKLIIAGGRAFKVTVSTNMVDCFDLKTLEWTTLPPMKYARFECGLAELNGELFAIGGNKLHCVEKFNFSKYEWVDVAPLLSPCNDVAVAVLNNLLYVVDEQWSSFQCYDRIENKWSQKALKNNLTHRSRIVALNGYLYAIGGFYYPDISDDCTAVERYDPEKNEWTLVASMESGQGSIQCVVWNDKILVFPGFIDWLEKLDIAEYSPELNLWKCLPFYIHPVDGHYDMHTSNVLVAQLLF